MKIAMAGFGAEGRAIVQYLSGKGHAITICDVRETLENIPKGVPTRLGQRYLEGLQEFDVIFRSPGIPYLTKEFKEVCGKLTSLTKFFFEHCPCKIIGVTGTKGKGTVSTLLSEMMRGTGRRVFLGGNIGRTPLTFLDELTSRDLVVLELSSFQLQDLDRSPHLAIVLGITPDHMDHHQNMAEYIEAKKNIVRFQKKGDFAVLEFDNEAAKSFDGDTKAKSLFFSTEAKGVEGGFLKVGSLVLSKGKTGKIFGEKSGVGLLGEHNLKNILAAAVAADVLGVPLQVIQKTVREFRGLPHRLEVCGETNGVRFINDSASTNPQTAIAALRAISASTILIAGGSDKNTDFSPLGTEIAKRPNVKTVVTMGQTQKKITEAVEQAVAQEERRGGSHHRKIPLELISAESYMEAFMVAKMIAQPGDTVLLSPACASFDMFTNYQERGDIFRDFVRQ